VEHKAVHAYLLIACHTHSLYQAFFVAKRTKSRHEPAVAVIPLSDVVCSCTFDEELRILEYILNIASASPRLLQYGDRSYAPNLDSFHRLRLKVLSNLVESANAVLWCSGALSPSLEIGLNVKVWIAILLIDPPALLYNLADFGLAGFDGMFVGCDGVFAGDGAFGGMSCCSLRIEVIGKDGEDLARMFCGELVPELLNGSLGSLLLHFSHRSSLYFFVMDDRRSATRSSRAAEELTSRVMRCHCEEIGNGRRQWRAWRQIAWPWRSSSRRIYKPLRWCGQHCVRLKAFEWSHVGNLAGE
jgi:hypothetical protein